MSIERQKLFDLSIFEGSGVYALYYTGNHPYYASISRTETPIYVGKASPNTARGTFDRLRKHLEVLNNCKNLDITDFEFRACGLDDIFILGAEEFLIRFFKPVWNKENKVLPGFGKHGDSSKTRRNKKSGWDICHPGRIWAKTQAEKLSLNELEQRLTQHFSLNKPFDPAQLGSLAFDMLISMR